MLQRNRFNRRPVSTAVPRPLTIPTPPPVARLRPGLPPRPIRHSCGFCARVRKLLGIAP